MTEGGEIKVTSSDSADAVALGRRLWELAQQSRHADAEAVFADMRKRFGDTDEPEVRAIMARAQTTTANTLGDAKRSADSLKLLDELVARFGHDSSSTVLESVADALLNAGDM